MSRGHDLRTLGDLTNRHMGRTITIRDLTGRLDGLTPVGNRIGLTLNIGGRRVFTDALPATEHVEVHSHATCPSCRRPWDRDLEPSTGVCPDCEHDRRREAGS